MSPALHLLPSLFSEPAAAHEPAQHPAANLRLHRSDRLRGKFHRLPESDRPAARLRGVEHPIA